MKIEIRESYPGHFTAIDDDTYDGYGSVIGLGSTSAEAEKDLLEKLEEAYTEG